MQFKTYRVRRIIVLAGLVAALGLGIMGSCAVRRTKRVQIETLDARAKPFFDEADRNIDAVVGRLTETKTLCKIAWYMARDKLSGSRKAQTFIAEFLQEPIIFPCKRGAAVYGCDFDTASFINILEEINSDYTATKAYAISGLALDALFLKTTMRAVYSVLGSVIARFAAACGGGTACALADGPLPFGDAVGIVLAAGGTIWCGYDLYRAHQELPVELSAVLHHAIADCQKACRMEALK